jgi:hypothetical protein
VPLSKLRLVGKTTLDSKHMLHSTRYDDRELLNGDKKDKLDNLATNLSGEIRACSRNVLLLERLALQYHSDGLAAQADRDIGYYMRYAEAYERVQFIVNSYYNHSENTSNLFRVSNDIQDR